MNGLKVYLKSRFSKVYFYAQSVIGLFLVANALRQFEDGGGEIFGKIAGVVLGFLMLASLATPQHLRQTYRYLPGMVIALAGIVLWWNTSANMATYYSHWHQPLIYVAYGLGILGLIQPLVDIKRYAYFGTKGVRYHMRPFQKSELSWSDVNSIDYHDEHFELSLKDGRSLKMVPQYAKSTNLRAHLDQLFYSSKSNPSKSGDPQKPISQQNELVAS
jgi:hypothetical protein